MRTAILVSLAWGLVLAFSGCGSESAGDGTGAWVNPAALSAERAPGLALGHEGGHGGHGDPGGHGGPGHWGCHDNGPGEDADVVDVIAGDEGTAVDAGSAVDAGTGPGPGACAGVFEMRAQEGPPDDGIPLSSWRSGPFTPDTDPLLYLVAIREPSGFPAGAEIPCGEVVLHIGPTQRPLILALSADQPTNWILDLADGAVIDSVVLLGNANWGLTNFDARWNFGITELTGGQPGAWDFCWPTCEDIPGTPGPILQLESATGRKVEAFDRAEHLEDLAIRHVCTDCTPQCDGRQCGIDGCGGICGMCPSGDACGDDGRCTGPDEDVSTGTCPGSFDLRFFEGLPDDSYPYTFYRAGPFVTGDEPLLHLVGIYESRTHHIWEGGSSPAGRAVLHIGPTQRPEVLALSAYEPTEWVLDLDPEAEIRSVVLMGYYAQTLTAPGTIPVQDLSGGNSNSGGYCWPFCEGGSDTRRLVESVQSATGMTLGAFDGVYHLEEAWIHHTCTGCVADCTGRVCGTDGCGGTCGNCERGYDCADDGRCLATDAAPPCTGLPADPHHCLGLTASGAALFGLETGEFCSLGPQTGILTAVGMGATSIAWQGDHVFACNSEAGYGGLIRFSLVDGTWDIAPLPSCIGVASWNGGLAVLISDFGFRIRAYASFEDVVARNPLPMNISVHASRFAVRGDTAFAAWHSTNEIQRVGLAGAGGGDPIPLEGFDTWVEGLSVTDDDLMVVNSWWPERRIAVFDAKTGAARWNLTNLPVTTDAFTGLVCRTR